MIIHTDVEKLRRMRAPEPAVLSLYLPVPLDPVGVRGLAAQAEDLMVGAGAGGPGRASIARAGHADRDAVLGALAAHGRTGSAGDDDPRRSVQRRREAALPGHGKRERYERGGR